MLAAQISNMDDGTRKLLEQSFGFKKQSPITSMPVGDERKMREMDQGFMGELMKDPTKRDQLRARRTGTQTQVQDQKDTLDLELGNKDLDYKKLNFEKLSDDVNIGKLLNAEKERSLKKLQEFRSRSGGKLDPVGLVDRIATNRATEQDMELYSVISNEPGMGDALGSMLEFRKIQDQQRNSLSLRTVGMQDDFLRLAMQSVNNASQEFSRASSYVNKVVSDAALAKISIGEALKADPQRAAMYNEALATRNESKARLDMYRPLVQKGFEKFEIKFPEVDPSSAAPAPPASDPELDMAKQALAQGVSREVVAKKYKQRTGKDLPR